MPPAARTETPFVVQTADEKMRDLRGLYTALKEDYQKAKQAFEAAEERLKVVKTAIEAELFQRSGGNTLVDLRVDGIPGALRMRHKPYTRVDRDALEAKYPEIYQQVLRVTYTWELREVK